MVLCAAAGGKLFVLAVDSFPDLRLGYPVPIIVVAIFAELAVSWIGSFRSPAQGWSAMIVWFSVLLSVSVAQHLLGGGQCHCFGIVELPRWASQAFNIVAVLVLLVLRPDEVKRSGIIRSVAHEMRKGLPQVVGFLAALLMSAFGANYLYSTGSLITAYAELDRNESNSKREFVYTVRNATTCPAEIVGQQRSCACISRPSLAKLVVPAGGELKIRFTIHVTRSGPLHHRVELFLRHPNQPKVSADIIGNSIVPRSGEI